MNGRYFIDLETRFSAPIYDSLDKALESAITPHTVAFMVEAIQGEAGIILPPPGYLAEVKAICATRNVLLILDEIQTGLCRTAKLLAQGNDGIKADMTLIGKSLTGGFYLMFSYR